MTCTRFISFARSLVNSCRTLAYKQLLYLELIPDGNEVDNLTVYVNIFQLLLLECDLGLYQSKADALMKTRVSFLGS